MLRYNHPEEILEVNLTGQENFRDITLDRCFPNLKELNVYNCRFTAPQYICPKVTTLTLENVSFCASDLYSCFPGLRTLFISTFDDIDLQGIETIKGITRLRIRGCRSIRNIKRLNGFRDLQELEIVTMKDLSEDDKMSMCELTYRYFTSIVSFGLSIRDVPDGEKPWSIVFGSRVLNDVNLVNVNATVQIKSSCARKGTFFSSKGKFVSIFYFY